MTDSVVVLTPFYSNIKGNANFFFLLLLSSSIIVETFTCLAKKKKKSVNNVSLMQRCRFTATHFTSTLNVSPSSYLTGMEIVALLSCMVEKSSSLSLQKYNLHAYVKLTQHPSTILDN